MTTFDIDSIDKERQGAEREGDREGGGGGARKGLTVSMQKKGKRNDFFFFYFAYHAVSSNVTRGLYMYPFFDSVIGWEKKSGGSKTGDEGTRGRPPCFCGSVVGSVPA